jgi:poly(hydroxyalkanoate) depolymerase family esterase
MKQRRMTEFSGPPTPTAVPDILTDMTDFGSNPGALRACIHVPSTMAPAAALVVVLHGCTQTADAYALGSGWTELADKHGFALLFPEQQRANNLNLCFNWFTTTDNRRDGGEVLSIRQMIGTMIDRHGCDPQRVFITGLSAGGAMASILLATCPELFKAGAIIAGLPFGGAVSMGDAFARMRGEGHPTDAGLAELVHDASDHQGRWPTVAAWHGTADTVVDPSNSERIIAQWQGVHAVADAVPERSRVDGARRRIWRNASGDAVIEAWQIDAMGHGTPLRTGGTGEVGVSGPYMLDVGISSTRHIAASWGLAPAPAPAQESTQAASRRPANRAAPANVAEIIGNALRAAGLKSTLK